MSRALSIRLFGIDAALAMAMAVGREGKPYWRGIFEIKSAVTQCNNVIGEFKADTICYICGFPIPAVKPASHELHVECEHVLPVAEGRWYLDLYDGSSDQDTKTLQLEYAYAHRVCNQAKSSDSFIRADIDGPISFDKPATITMLNTIKARASRATDKFPDPKGYLKKISDMVTSDRAEKISKEKIEPILAHVNKPAGESPGLALLARTVSVVDDARLSVKARDAYKPFSDPAYQEKRKVFNAALEEFKVAAKVEYDSMLTKTIEGAPDDFKEQVGAMQESKRDDLMLDWFTILYKGVPRDEAGTIQSDPGSSEYQNAKQAGYNYVLFRLCTNTFKLLPYISKTSSEPLRNLKYELIDSIQNQQSAYERTIGATGLTMKAFLKNAGIYVEKEEVDRLFRDQDVEVYETVKKAKTTKRNREEAALGREERDDPEDVEEWGAADVLAEIKRARVEGGTRRAKLFRRTKRSHHPGLSKKLKRRSYRKRRMGKQTTKTRY